MPLSAIVLTQNSEKTLDRCLASLSFCDEIIVGDDNSTDSTQTVAQKYTKKIVQHTFQDDFSAQRNWIMGQASHDWIIFIDSDEVVSLELQAEIKTLHLEHSLETTCYRIKRVDVFMGEKLSHGELAGAAQKGIIRLMRKATGSWKGVVHEEWVPAAGETGTLQNKLMHYPHPTIADFLRTVNRYSSLRAKELYATKKNVFWFDLLAYPFGKFFSTYFLKGGFKDGPGGFIYSFMMSFHSFLVRAKLFQYYLDAKPATSANY